MQNLENEISSHKALSQVVTGTGYKLVQAGHFAAEEVAARVQQLEVALNHLETEAARRKRMLQQALEVQQALVEVRRMLSDEGCQNWPENTGVYGTERRLPGQAELCPTSPASSTLLSLFLPNWGFQLELYVKITWNLSLAITSELPHKLNK